MLTVGNRKGMFKIMLIDKIRKYKAGTTLFQGICQILQRSGYICLLILRIKINQLTDNVQNMSPPFFRRYKFLDTVGKEYHPNLIIILYGRKSNHSSNFRNLIFLQLGNRTEITGSAYIDHQHNSQFPFFLIYFDIRMIVACRHIPIDIPDIVTVLILPYFAESHTPSLKSRMVFSRKDITGQAPGLYLDFPYPL